MGIVEGEDRVMGVRRPVSEVIVLMLWPWVARIRKWEGGGGG